MTTTTPTTGRTAADQELIRAGTVDPSSHQTQLGPSRRGPGRRGSGSRTWRSWVPPSLGLAALVSLAGTVVLGLWLTPPDVFQGNLVRLIYVHPPVAWVAYLAFGVTTLASLAYLWPRTRDPRWDHLAGASAEIGVVFSVLTLATGSIWGRPTWGVWWTWDARLTTTAILAVLYLGYLALRRVPADGGTGARRCAVAALLAFADVPISYLSVYWWNTLHQTGTVLNPQGQTHIHGSMAWTMLLGFCGFTLLYSWLLLHRYRVEAAGAAVGDRNLELALAERRAEAVTP